MGKKIILTIFMGLAIVVGMAVAALASEAGANGSLQAVVSADNRLGLALFERLGKSSGNLAISPLSIGTAASMALAGARGATASEMDAALGYHLSPSANAQARDRLLAPLQHPAKADSPVFVAANALMLTQFGDLIAPSYRRLLIKQFGAELFTEANLATVNAWVNDKTRGRIKTILSRLDPNSVCVLLNAVYFKGAWRFPFNKRQTAPGPFHLLGNEVVQVPMMHRAGSFRVLRAHAFDAIALPYANSTLAMVVLVPMRVEGIGYLSGLGAKTLDAVLAGLNKAAPESVDLSMPRFTVESGANLIPPLRDLGIKLAFDRDRADFSGMTQSSAESKRIHISQVRTKAFVAVDEAGTEAAGATAVEFAKRSMAQRKRVSFRVDRPFVFVIADMKSGSLLFIGRVMDPRSKQDAAQATEPSPKRGEVALQANAAKRRVENLFKDKKPVPKIGNVIFGGPCRYDLYKGACTIRSVRKTEASIHQKTVEGGSGYEGYEVRFSYAGDAPRGNAQVQRTLAREHEFRLTNSWYPGPRYIKKYGITAGKIFSCTLKVITSGACTPIVFDFPAIDSVDYFERGNRN